MQTPEINKTKINDNSIENVEMYCEFVFFLKIIYILMKKKHTHNNTHKNHAQTHQLTLTSAYFK